MTRKWIWWSAIAVVLFCIVVSGASHGLRTTRSRIHATVEERLRSYFGDARVGEANLGWPADVVIGPIEIAAQTPGAPPVLRIERLILRPRLIAMLVGRAELRGVRLEGVSVKAGPNGAEARALWEHIERRRAQRKSAAGSTFTAPSIEFSDLRLAAEVRGMEVALGPFWGTIRLGREAPQDIPTPLFSEAGRVELALGLAGDRADLSARFGGFELEPLVAAFAPPVALHRGQMSGRIQLAGSRSSGFNALVQLDAREIFLVGEHLSDAPVGPIRIGIQGPVGWNAKERLFTAGPAQVRIGEGQNAAFRVGGQIDDSGLESGFRIRIEPDQLSFAQLVSALPEDLRPPPAVRSMDGPVGGSLEIHGPLHHRADWELRANIDLKPLRETLRASDPLRMHQEFQYRVPLASGAVREIRVGPGGPHFVPLSELPEFLVRAVLLSEDSGFYAHSGFDLPELWSHLVGGADRRGIVRGGSTITQQLAKNLFFGREKTYVRKFREALATVALEASIPKNRILEIYLNIIEWGPGLYGIGEAATHYFGKDPRELSVREAVFLATIIPNPVKYHGYCSHGGLTEVWEQRMRDLLEKMHGAGVLSEEQFERGMNEPLTFVHGGKLVGRAH